MKKTPTLRFMLAHPAHLVALGFGTGLSPIAPGTVGTLLALPLDALLRALPADVALSVEMPYPSLPADARLALAYGAARRVVDGLGVVSV